MTLKYYFQVVGPKMLCGEEHVLRRFHLDHELADSAEDALMLAFEFRERRVREALEGLRWAMDRMLHCKATVRVDENNRQVAIE